MERQAADLTTMVRQPLAPAHVEALRRAGREVPVKAGEVVARLGDPAEE